MLNISFNIIEFKWPYLILLLPLPIVIPIIINYFIKIFGKSNNINNNTDIINTGLYIPYYQDLLSQYNNIEIKQNKNIKLNILNILLFLTWISFIIAIMRPIHIGKPINLPTPSHDIIMALDISKSMLTEDMSKKRDINRLDIVKQIGHDFINKRTNDRVGLVFFGTSAFVSSPLTLDQKSLHNFLEKTQIGFAGGKTAIGDALGLAIKKLELDNKNNSRFIILLSDGSNNSGVVEPIDAAHMAAKNNIKIYTIGIGSNSNNSLDILSGLALDDETLKAIAKITNGLYFHATDKTALAEIYNKINKLEPTSQTEKILRPETEWFIYPLLLVFICLILRFILQNKK